MGRIQVGTSTLMRMTPKMETVARVGIMALPDFSMM